MPRSVCASRSWPSALVPNQWSSARRLLQRVVVEIGVVVGQQRRQRVAADEQQHQQRQRHHRGLVAQEPAQHQRAARRELPARRDRTCAVVADSVVTGSRHDTRTLGIERGVDDVGQQARQQDRGAGEHRDRGDDVGVLGRDALHHPLAHAVPAEDLLGEHRAGDQTADAVGEQRGHRDQRRAQAVFEQRLPPGQSLGAGGADEVLAEHVEHRVALIAAVPGDGDQRERERRQHQMLQAVDELVPRARRPRPATSRRCTRTAARPGSS